MTQPEREVEVDWNPQRRQKTAAVLAVSWALVVFYLGAGIWGQWYTFGRADVGRSIVLLVLLAGGPLAAWRTRVLRRAAIIAGVALGVLLAAAPVLFVVYYFVAGGAAR